MPSTHDELEREFTELQRRRRALPLDEAEGKAGAEPWGSQAGTASSPSALRKRFPTASPRRAGAC